MSRVKTFVATGVAPDGKLFAGDLNLIQDQYADLTNFAQNVSVSTLRVGDSGIQIVKFGTAEMRITAALRVDGILRSGGAATGGIVPGQYTTTERNAIGAGFRPYGLALVNTVTNQWEWNSGSDAVPNWKPLGVDPSGNLIFTGTASALSFTEQAVNNYFITAKRSADAVARFAVKENGNIEFGPGGGVARDTILSRSAAGELAIGGIPIILDNDSALTDQRVPLDLSVTNAKVAAAANIALSKLASLPLVFTTALGAAQHRMQAGNKTGNVNGVGQISVAFPTPFGGATSYIVLTNRGAQQTTPRVATSDANGFTATFQGLNGDPVDFDWQAIGLA